MSNYKPVQWLSPTSLACFARCPRRFFYYKGQSLRLVDEHPALKYGEAIHAALPMVLTKGVDAAFRAFCDVWSDTPEDDYRSAAKAFAMLQSFAFSHEGTKSLYTLVEPPRAALEVSDKNSPFEVPFAVDIGMHVPLVGKIDAMVRRRDTGELWALEWKTTKELGQRFFEQFTLHPQPVVYTMVLQAFGEPVRGCFVEGLRVSKTDRTEDMLVPVYVPAHVIKGFITWAKWQSSILQMMEQRLADGVVGTDTDAEAFPMNYCGCTPYASHGMPGYTCEYQRMCLAADWRLLKDLYRIHDERPFNLNQLHAQTVTS